MTSKPGDQISGKNARSIPVEEIFNHFSTSSSTGLSDSDSIRLLNYYGENEISSDDSETLFSKYLDQFKDPMIIMLLVSAGISLLLGQFSDAFSIGLAIVIVCSVAFIQEYRSDKAIDQLQELVKHSTTVIRDGETKKVDSKNVVPGDIVVFRQGDRIPADIRIQTCKDLRVDESVFTGESVPSKKICDVVNICDIKGESPLRNKKKDISERHDLTGGSSEEEERFDEITIEEKRKKEERAMLVQSCKNVVFMGTIVSDGYGRGIVVSTGDNTELGRISHLLSLIKEKKTPLEITMGILAKQITYISLVIIGIIFIIGIITGKPLLDMFQMGISLAVAAIPEGLPVVVTVTLAMGVLRMAKKNTIVRKLQSVETLGAVNILCCDKTGTLTKNQMTVKYVYLHDRKEDYITVTGSGYEISGGKFLCNKIESFPPIRGDTDDENLLGKCNVLDTLLITSNICSTATLSSKGVIGLPTEGALIVASRKRGIPEQRNVWEKIESESISFSSSNKWMGVSAVNKDTGEKMFFAKGALEIILEKCTSYVSKNGKKKLLDDDKETIMKNSNLFAGRNLRVLAMANGKKNSQLSFIGFVGIYDPPREGVKESIGRLHSAGIKVVMITGDSKPTAISIARDLNIISPSIKNFEDVALCVRDIIDEEKLEKKVEYARLFYRVAPEHKMAIITALQKRGYVVGMTGDGINDAPALKTADIGISMGKSGTDVSKEASSMILLDDNIRTIMTAIEEGKSIFNNIKNFLRYQLTTSVTAMGLIIFSTIFSFPLPLNPMQVLYVNMIMDGAPAQSLGLEPVDHDVMKKPPRNIKSSPISKAMIFSIIINSIIMLCGSLSIFIKEFTFDNIVDARDTTMVFSTFVLFQIFNAFNCRSELKSVFQIGFFKNKPLIVACGISVFGLLLLIYVPLFQQIFDTVSLGFFDWFIIVPIASTVLIIEEGIKYFRRASQKPLKKKFVKE